MTKPTTEELDALQFGRVLHKRPAKTYDPACYDLAQSFLSDVPDATEPECDELATLIQRTVEDFIKCRKPVAPASTNKDGDTAR